MESSQVLGGSWNGELGPLCAHSIVLTTKSISIILGHELMETSFVMLTWEPTQPYRPRASPMDAMRGGTQILGMCAKSKNNTLL